MPDTIRKRCGKTHPWRGRFAQSCAAFATLLPNSAAAESGALHPVIGLPRCVRVARPARNRGPDAQRLASSCSGSPPPSRCCARAHAPRERLPPRQSEINELREERDRASALLLAEPQVIVVWPAGADEPDITGDISILLRTPLPRRVLAFGSWLGPEQALADGRRGRRAAREGKSFSLALTTLQQRHVAGRRPRDRRARGAAHQGLDRDARASSPSLPPDHEQLRRDIDTVGQLLEALPAPVWARDGQGASHLGQRRLCARRRGARRHATRSRATSKFSIRRRATARSMHVRRARPTRRDCR